MHLIILALPILLILRPTFADDVDREVEREAARERLDQHDKWVDNVQTREEEALARWQALTEEEKELVVEEARQRAKMKHQMLEKDVETLYKDMPTFPTPGPVQGQTRANNKNKKSTTTTTDTQKQSQPKTTTTTTTTATNINEPPSDPKPPKNILANMLNGIIDEESKAKIRQTAEENRAYLKDMDRRRRDEPVRRLKVLEFTQQLAATQAELDARTPKRALLFWASVFTVTFLFAIPILRFLQRRKDKQDEDRRQDKDKKE